MDKLSIPKKSKQRDRNLSDLTPVLAEYIMWHAIGHIRDVPPGDKEAEKIIEDLVAKVNPRG